MKIVYIDLNDDIIYNYIYNFLGKSNKISVLLSLLPDQPFSGYVYFNHISMMMMNQI